MNRQLRSRTDKLDADVTTRHKLLTGSWTADVETLERLLSEQPSTAGRPGRVRGVTAQWGGIRSDLDGFTEQ